MQKHADRPIKWRSPHNIQIIPITCRSPHNMQTQKEIGTAQTHSQPDARKTEISAPHSIQTPLHSNSAPLKPRSTQTPLHSNPTTLKLRSTQTPLYSNPAPLKPRSTQTPLHSNPAPLKPRSAQTRCRKLGGTENLVTSTPSRPLEYGAVILNHSALLISEIVKQLSAPPFVRLSHLGSFRLCILRGYQQH
jgi:hypothetical protein